MHGQNIVRKAEHRPDGHLQVHEVFYTIQGEGPFTGHPAVFVRLTGCNLRCWFCDTHWDDDNDVIYSPEQVVAAVIAKAGIRCKLIVLTGGEPMRQRLFPFIWELFGTTARFLVQVETAGTLWQPELGVFTRDQLQYVVSPKAGVDPRMMEKADAFKFIIKDGDQDAEMGEANWSTQITAKGRQSIVRYAPPSKPVYLSPLDEEDEIKNTANRRAVTSLALKYGWIAGIQLHKVLGVP